MIKKSRKGDKFSMEYRINKKTGDKFSIIGLDTSYIADTEEKEAVAALRLAHENG